MAENLVDEVLLVRVAAGVATVWLNRPHQRNALNTTLVAAIPVAVSEAAQRDDVRVIVITGSDPAFCAGLDLKELGSTGANLGLPANPPYRWPWEVGDKPVIGAINGATVAGGFEMALHCDILVASERARFADTHARVGQLPGAGLTVRLPRLIGPGRARELSLSGNFIDAATALQWGLVSHVVPHEQLLPFAQGLATDIAANDPETVLAMNQLYGATEDLTFHEALDFVARATVDWQAGHHDPSFVALRREAIIARAHNELDRLDAEHGR